jgi:hypothetical protein
MPVRGNTSRIYVLGGSFIKFGLMIVFIVHVCIYAFRETHNSLTVTEKV